MAISYPLAFPTAKGPSGITLRARSAVGVSASPFTYAQQVFAHAGEMWEADVQLPPMKRANAEVWIAFFLALNGRQGTFLMGDPVNTTPQGSWSGQSPLANGSHAAGVKTVAIDGLTAASTGTAGDWLQVGTGSSTRLHKLAQDFTADGTGAASLEIWPALRDTLDDNAAIVLASPKGQWRLASNLREWSIELAQIYGLRFACTEAL